MTKKNAQAKTSPRRPVETILVTGAGGLLGRRLVERLLLSGRDVVAVYRSKPADLPSTTGARLHPVTLDLTKKGGVARLIATLAKMRCDVTGIVHCARSRTNLAIDRLPTREQWSNEFELGVSVAHELVYEMAALPETKLRRVVLVGSMYGVVAVSPHLYPKGMTPPPLHYGVTKAAMVHLTKELAVPLAARGINVNAVSIGGIEGRTGAAFKRRYRQLCPQGRMLSVDEAAAPIEFLLSDAAGGIVGHNLVVDGGWSIW
ncbi:MAG: SDR family oxidoreductase [Proteobacteria bacterium]|nr:SDR family oxidoreductase [Pseudomonadota bacterium]